MKKVVLTTVLVLSFLLSACAPQAIPTMAPAPTQAPLPTATPAPTEAPDPKDIVDTAIADGRFTTLVTALQAANLVDTLKGEGPFTVFAPTDEAFSKLPEGTIEALLADIPQLTNILLYHVIPAKVMAADVLQLNGQSADTALEGAQISIEIRDGNVILNGNVMVIITDIVCSNGVIHVIDLVLLPPAE
jgi:uncharacterized surface protein with fasciclin (FAS1) repeats